MDDLISRQAAIDEIGEWIKAFLENGHKESAADACLIQDGIIQLPSAQPEQRWIPVSERPPDVSESVLICDIDGDIYIGYRTRLGDYYPDFCDDKIESVIAWMPLPEPYREEGQDD